MDGWINSWIGEWIDELISWWMDGWYEYMKIQLWLEPLERLDGC